MESKPLILRNAGQYPLWLLIGIVVILAIGCAGTPSSRTVSKSPDLAKRDAVIHPEPRKATSATTANDLEAMEQRLRSEVQQWKGTPHRMGGTSQGGIDCSGFVQRLYRDILGQTIPRSTAQQVKAGQSIEQNHLITGDLVFFKLPRKGRHVGIYLGQAEFAHASTSKGVTISSLENRFWRNSYWTARRYLDPPN